MAKHETALIRPVPLAEQIRAWCQARRDDIGRMTADSPEDIDTEELATIWHDINTFHRELGVWVRDIAVELGHRLEDMPEGYDHRTLGTLEARRPHQNVKWDGRRVLSGLAQTMIDGNGEHTEAVPVAALEKAIPGINGTSSRWNVSGLPEHLRKLRDVTYGATLPQINPMNARTPLSG